MAIRHGSVSVRVLAAGCSPVLHGSHLCCPAVGGCSPCLQLPHPLRTWRHPPNTLAVHLAVGCACPTPCCLQQLLTHFDATLQHAKRRIPDCLALSSHCRVTSGAGYCQVCTFRPMPVPWHRLQVGCAAALTRPAGAGVGLLQCQWQRKEQTFSGAALG